MMCLKIRKNTNPYQPDVVLFLALIPCISAFNYYLTYSNIHLNWFLVLSFLNDTFQGYLAWWFVRSFILYLDKRYPYGTKPAKRIALQIISTTFLGLLVISVLTELTSWMVRGKPATPSFYTVDLFIISIWFFVINGIYIGLYYYNTWQASEVKRQEENRIKKEGLLVKHGKQDLKISFDELSALYVDGEYVVAHHATGKKYFLDQSLEKIEKQLPSLDFFRINRQYILHRNWVSGFKRVENGKLQVLVKKGDGLPTDIQVSRTKAPAFKSWFHPRE